MSEFNNYTNISSIKKDWIEKIAPNYFDLDNVNNYQSGIFGYINEVMAEAVEDGFNATNVARKEFYPVTAQFDSSIYKMAAMQKLDIPMCTPARCKAVLLLTQKEIIENSTLNKGVYECTIDSCLKIFADNLQFMLDYPIKILSTKSADGSFVHTIHYDINVKNSLVDSRDSTYISNKIISEHGVIYTVLFLDNIRQVECFSTSNILQQDSNMTVASFETEFDGNLANFEVFYRETPNSPKMQLAKIMRNAAYPAEPFVCYELINPNKIQFTFPNNSIFSPSYNSEVLVNIYTSMGEDGNFDEYNGDLICSSDSEDYPYNANMIIVGKVNGASIGGKNMPSKEEFRNEVINSYATNKTISISNDLQLFFDKASKTIKSINVMFRKKRDDAFIRQYGAYILLKDEMKNAIPTNTLNLKFKKSDIMKLDDSASRLIIKPGTIFEYENPSSYDLVIKKDIKLLDITDNRSTLFTNPFLIAVNVDPNLVGYYLNSINTRKSVQYTYVNDKISDQFISSGLTVYRNAMNGSNYYELSMALLPSSSDFDFDSVVNINDPTDPVNIIIAEKNGEIISKLYTYDNVKKAGFVEVIYKYNDSDTTYKIQSSPIINSDGTRITGYNVRYNVGDRFVVGDILATKMDDDLGNLTIVGDINNQLYENNLYIPFTIEKMMEEGGILLKAYLSTDDSIDNSNNIPIIHGIYNKDGTENENVAIPMSNVRITLNSLYNNVGNNIPHKYSDYETLNKFSMTNTYVTDHNDLINFIEAYSFIRSTADYVPTTTPKDLAINIIEIPVIQAWWANKDNNYAYFINKVNNINHILKDAYRRLENGYGIDMKFYNSFGKSRFYKIGGGSIAKKLDTVTCKLKFGINVLALTNINTFIEKFKLAIKEYIEDTSNITTIGQNIYIMNLVSYLKEKFQELIYLEYYGINEFDNDAQKILGPKLEEYNPKFIPEFINIGIVYDENNMPIPDIEVTLLED